MDPTGQQLGPRVAPTVGEWAREKHELLRYYIGGTAYKGGGFMTAVRRARGSFYIDLFAGAGQSTLPDGSVIDGSPLIAAKATPPFTKLWWVEANAANAASLRSHRQDFPNRDIEIVHGDANQAISEILNALPTAFPVLAFLDPYSTQLDWETIRRLAAHRPRRKIELFVLFPLDMVLFRLMPHDQDIGPFAPILDRMMPDPQGWRRVYSNRAVLSAPDRRRAMLNEYVVGLRRLGYEFVPPPRLVTRPDGHGLYFMVFATDHPAGERIMRYALERVEHTARQTSFLDYDERY
jgi:three-Cys-motif partner protein